MGKDPWKDPDPQPGDFDAELDHAQIEMHKGNPNAKLSILVSVEGGDAKRLERIADERGQQPGEVVSEFLQRLSDISWGSRSKDLRREALRLSGSYTDGPIMSLGREIGWATWS